MVLELDNLRYQHPGQARPFIHIDHFALQAGERVLLHGPSGCGKSTLLSLVTGIRPARDGNIRVSGKPFSSLSQRRRDAFRADHIGVIFQAFNLLPYLNAVDNVCLSAGFSRRRCEREGASSNKQRRIAAQELLTRLGLDAAPSALPAWQLSFGQQQRVAAARALFGKPDLIIADEPTSALDADSRDTLLALLCEQCEQAGSALLMVSHDSQVADRSWASSVCVIRCVPTSPAPCPASI
ncbi:ABC transporter ATP-binding protein [Alcanivorax sp.]|uniref:ABC transporter ATP-binding protein n=1 Tax=Alcanivorax sp. TaxID=1872427 RepID=UPI0025C406B4|nr:ABC transporter ATP-binding protein [Alcanivorax sp.]